MFKRFKSICSKVLKPHHTVAPFNCMAKIIRTTPKPATKTSYFNSFINYISSPFKKKTDIINFSEYADSVYDFNKVSTPIGKDIYKYSSNLRHVKNRETINTWEFPSKEEVKEYFVSAFNHPLVKLGSIYLLLSYVKTNDNKVNFIKKL